MALEKVFSKILDREPEKHLGRKLVKDVNGYDKLVAGDDWHLRRYTDIPDWCPKL